MITARQMTVEPQSHLVSFEGKVRLERGELVMTADRMDVLLSEDSRTRSERPSAVGPGGERGIQQITAIGNVEVQQGERRVRSGRAVYRREAETVVLSENPRASEPGYEVEGKRITLFLKDRRSVIEESRVKFDTRPPARP